MRHGRQLSLLCRRCLGVARAILHVSGALLLLVCAVVTDAVIDILMWSGVGLASRRLNSRRITMCIALAVGTFVYTARSCVCVLPVVRTLRALTEVSFETLGSTSLAGLLGSCLDLATRIVAVLIGRLFGVVSVALAR